jgi:hypothetical protein
MVIRRIGIPRHKVARTDQEILADTGHVLYGERWIAAFARDIGVSQQYVSQIASAQRALTVEQRLKLAVMCSVWLNNLTARRESVEAMERYWRRTADDGFRPDNLKRGRDGPAS